MLVFCNDPKCKEDTSLYCFVDEQGKHFSPRLCTCMRYVPSWEERWMDGERISNSVVRKRNMEKHGKVNPLCPIPEPHEPIDSQWRT